MDSSEVKKQINELQLLLSGEDNEKNWAKIKSVVYDIAKRILSTLSLEKVDLEKIHAVLERKADGKHPEHLNRPWGHMDIFDETFNTGCMARLISVNPSKKLSQQSHTLRDEIYIGVTDALVSIGDDPEYPLSEASPVMIKRGTKHRLSGIQRTTATRVIEIALYNPKDYTDLDAYQRDIHRYADEYGRPEDGE